MLKFINILFSILIIQSAYAEPSLNTDCILNPVTNELTGSQVNQMAPLASVSKVFTSYWATVRLGLLYRYPTTVYLKKDGEAYSVHIKGSQQPYFDRDMLNLILSHLQKKGVKKITNLSFDENFDYANDVRTNINYSHGPLTITTDQTSLNLKNDILSSKKNYKSFYNKYSHIKSLKLTEDINITVDNTFFTKNEDFHSQDFDSSFVIYSSSLFKILKELNRNSHNYASEKIYSKLSQQENFSDFMTSNLNINSHDIEFINGSGYPAIINNSKRYNHATCRSVVTLLNQFQKKSAEQGFALKQILPIAGLDLPDDGEINTVTALYSDENLNQALAAKTGTLSTMITLGGLLSTQDGEFYFYLNVNNNGTLEDRKSSSDLIKNKLIDFYNHSNGKKSLVDFSPEPFTSFDFNQDSL